MNRVHSAPVSVAMVRQPPSNPQHSASTNIMATPAHKLIRRGHQLELLQQAKQLCDQQDYVDLTIYCEDGVVRAHQMLLATASPFLKLLFQTSPLYGVDEISLILPEVKACLVQALVHFVYTGTVVSKEDHFYSLMKLVYALNINASIEAESTNDKPTSFSAPLTISHIESPSKKKFPYQTHKFQNQLHQTLSTLTPQQPPSSVLSGSSANLLPQLPNQPLVSLPTHPVPPAKIPRLANLTTSGQLIQQSPMHKMPIQLPTQPLPLQGMVNGNVQQIKTETAVSQAPQHATPYILDANTGIQYKVETGTDSSDPLAAIMNETIFTESSGAVYSGENGTIIYSTHQPTAVVASQASQVPTVQPTVTSAAPVVTAPITPAAKGKKRKAGNKDNQIMTGSVDDVPCTPDDDDMNVSYSCEQCNKSIKGRVMLQAHQFQEHYDNPDLANLEVGDKYPCRVCLKLFTRNSDVKAHILRVHCGDRRYPCSICGKRFKESTHLRKHLYTHTGERPHFCTLCSKGFQTSSDLKRHKRTKVHQERAEQANPGESGLDTSSNLNDSKDEIVTGDNPGEFNQWSSSQGGSTTPAPPQPKTSGVDSTAQALLSSITQPLSGAQQSANVSNANFTASPSTTIDMKALGGTTTWNNNQQQTTVAGSTPGSSTTLDLKAIGGTVDMNTLKWQPPHSNSAPSAPQAEIITQQQIKRSSSADSPNQDEERLTVVEGEDSSQDSVQQQASNSSGQQQARLS